MTADYTLVGIERQQELIQAIQDRLRAAAEKVEEKRNKQRHAASAEPVLGDEEWGRFMGGLPGDDSGKER